RRTGLGRLSALDDVRALLGPRRRCIRRRAFLADVGNLAGRQAGARQRARGGRFRSTRGARRRGEAARQRSDRSPPGALTRWPERYPIPCSEFHTFRWCFPRVTAQTACSEPFARSRLEISATSRSWWSIKASARTPRTRSPLAPSTCLFATCEARRKDSPM